ncbi:hypothetical protein L227DRAFT_611794 [Lentinus tigrinus ALCF2SS1-6]|uniref:Uncharacterized protein n=1 Tax=Lentinus tigrinus ALCF2SS1-6 TaxID=1328759 RepID=A0A5C2S8S1_9APHY|nr:hypothetical protein L227DRAFT_611794 [Lentinus tigrinus ALCF2SS1-6]
MSYVLGAPSEELCAGVVAQPEDLEMPTVFRHLDTSVQSILAHSRALNETIAHVERRVADLQRQIAALERGQLVVLDRICGARGPDQPISQSGVHPAAIQGFHIGSPHTPTGGREPTMRLGTVVEVDEPAYIITNDRTVMPTSGQSQSSELRHRHLVPTSFPLAPATTWGDSLGRT